ncbi:condensation domain-containing protein [Nocardia sp. NPDC127526]|uniref:condensation domain-containing protein n=1 Tax=Nocardia sp. NPDC127526 TaxID=3345393 RepID=UPI003644ABD1
MTTPAPRPDDIAIVGLGVRFPDASDLGEFRANLAAGRDSIGPMPQSRAEATALDRRVDYLPMGHLTDIHSFDYAFFGLSKREASLMDPQQRIALELAHTAIEDAGYAPRTLRDATTAVVFSAPMPTYHAMAVDPGPLAMLGNLPFGTPARIAHLLGLTGPCYAIDSGCNASLIAVHHACRELRSGDADYALAGGVSIRAGGSPAWTMQTMTEIASTTGKVRAFDAEADGTVPGEGGAALLLTTLARAHADRAPVYAVIRGSAVLHNGHSAVTISTPSATAQARVIERAWRAAGADPRNAGYLEAHGSATRLGDAVELEGLRTAFAGRANPLPIGSVKTNIGHLDHAAGVAGLVKAVLSVHDGHLYPSLHFHRPTGDLDLAAAGIEVLTRPRPWDSDEPRLAGVSSYSLGGANAHCVVQQAPDIVQQAAAAKRRPTDVAQLPSEVADGAGDVVQHVSDLPLKTAEIVRQPGDVDSAGEIGRQAPDAALRPGGVARQAADAAPSSVGGGPHAGGIVADASDVAQGAGAVVGQAPDVVYSSVTGADREPERRLVGVSARTPAALAELCGTLAGRLRGSAVDLADVAFTLGRGRAHFGYRIAVCATSTADLAEELELRGAAVDPEGGQPVAPRVALLLSPGSVDSGATSGETSSVSSLSVGMLTGDEIRPSLPAQLPAPEHVAPVLRRQIMAHDLLRACGIRFTAILSGGASKYLARYLLGSTAAVQAGELAEAAANPAVNRSRLRAAAETLLRDGPVVFVDPSEGGELGRLLAEDLADRADAEIIFGSADAPGMLDVVGSLYERGLDIDWAGVQNGDGMRVRLPGHPMHRTRCWVELPTAAALPAEPVAAAVVRAETSTPSDATEWLRGVLRELLHAESEIGADEDYFDLGGNSIIAVQLVERVEESFGFRPKLLDVYERPKVSDFAALLSDGAVPTAAEAGRPARSAPPITRTDELVMSPGQERMWFHHQLVPDTTLYNYPVVNVLRGAIDSAAIKGTFEDFAQRHEPLRYNLVEVDGLPVVRVRPALAEFFRAVDVSGAGDPVAVARGLIREAATTPFDLARDPMVRVLLVTLAPDMHVLQVTCHHCVTDGQTPGILAREIPLLYAARQEGRTAELEPLPVRYRDYARWHRDLLDSGALDHELEYWTHSLRNAPKLRLPTDFPRPARKTFAGDLEPFTVPAELLAAARAVAKRESVSLFVVMLSAFYILLARRSGQRDLVIGTPTTGRTRRELEGLIGFFNSTVALRANLSGPATLADLLERVRAIVLGALENQEIPFERVVNALDDQRDVSRTPIFDVLYVHQDLVGTANPLSGGETEFFDLEHSIENAFGGLPAGTAKFDLSLITYDRSDDHDMLACFEYSTELFTQRTAAGFAATYLEILTEVVGSAPDRSIDELIAAPSPAGIGSAEPGAALDIPTDRPRKTGQVSYTPATVRERFDGEPEDAVLLAAWIALLAWYSGSDEVEVGLAGGAARMDLADDPDGVALIARAAAALTAAATSAADYATSAATDAAGAVSEAAGAVGKAAGAVGDVAIRFRDARPGAAELVLDRSLADDGPVVELAYATELFDESTAQQMLADLVGLLHGLAETPDEPVADIALRCIAEAEVTR